MKVIIPATRGMMEMAENAAATLQVFDREAEICLLATGTELIDQTYNKYGTSEFRAVTLRKIEAVLSRLRDGETVLLIDADIVVKRDPVPYLENIGADLVIQDDSPNLHDLSGPLCTGFFVAQPTRPVIRLFENSVALVKDGVANDQLALNSCINDCNDVSLHRLDQQLFPNGRIWRNYRPSESYIVHANYVRGQEKKAGILKRTGLYGGGSFLPFRLIYQFVWGTVGAMEHLAIAHRNRSLAAHKSSKVSGRKD